MQSNTYDQAISKLTVGLSLGVPRSSQGKRSWDESLTKRSVPNHEDLQTLSSTAQERRMSK